MQKEINLEDPTPFLDHVHLGCTQRVAKVDPQAVQSKTELFKKLTTTKEADEKDSTKEKHLLETITAWGYDMEGHAEKCVERNCELEKKCVCSPAGCHTTRKQVATHTMQKRPPNASGRL